MGSQLRRRHTLVAVGFLALSLIALGPACSGIESGGRHPISPSSASAPPDSLTISAAPAGAIQTVKMMAGALRDYGGRDTLLGLTGGVSGPTDVTFPPRNEPLMFRNALEAKYRDSLRRGAVLTFVDQEGTVVWVQEYIRYRVNLCSHAEAVLRVFRQIDGQGVQPICGVTSTATFPPRQEPLDFMVQLEAKYRDQLRRTAGPSFVDVEGNVIWTQEYLRYRVTSCSHSQAQQKVFDQIDGRGVQADCQPVFTIFGQACACVRSAIQIRFNGVIAGTMGCGDTRTFPVPTGSYTVTACANEGCFTTGSNPSYFGPFTGSDLIRLTC